MFSPLYLTALTCHSLTPGAEEEGEDKLEATGRRRSGCRLRGHHIAGAGARQGRQQTRREGDERRAYPPLRRHGDVLPRNLTSGFSSVIPSFLNVDN